MATSVRAQSVMVGRAWRGQEVARGSWLTAHPLSGSGDREAPGMVLLSSNSLKAPSETCRSWVSHVSVNEVTQMGVTHSISALGTLPILDHLESFGLLCIQVLQKNLLGQVCILSVFSSFGHRTCVTSQTTHQSVYLHSCVLLMEPGASPTEQTPPH